MNKTLSKKFLMCFLLLFLLFKPTFLDYKFHGIYRILTYLVAGYSVYMYLKRKSKGGNPSAIAVAFFAFEGWILLMTFSAADIFRMPLTPR